MNRGKVSIDKTPLGKKAADIIRQRIIKGVYNQGARLIEEELAGEFDISRACIRDAFLILESEGMVKRERNKYTKVLKLKQNEIEDLFRFRLILELHSIETCIEKKCIPADTLQQCIKEMDKAMGENNINSFKYVENDLSFHEAIVESANNVYVTKIYKSIKYQIMTLLYFLFNRFKEEFSLRGKGQHYKISEFMEKGDVKNAQEFLKEHIQNNLDFVIKLNKRVEAS